MDATVSPRLKCPHQRAGVVGAVVSTRWSRRHSNPNVVAVPSSSNCSLIVDAVDPQLNAVVVSRADQARTEAATADMGRREGRPLGSLHGLPVLAVTSPVCSIATSSSAERLVRWSRPLAIASIRASSR
jgi:hypothetical protein